jgi:acetylornithine deacetylase
LVERESVIQLLGEMVSIDSVNPSLAPDHPGEMELQSFLLGWFEERGISCHLQQVEGDRGNVVAKVGEGEGRLLMVSHMDTVGVDDMTIPPFSPVVKGDLLYGRGSADTKGGMAAAMLAMESLHELGELDGQLILAATVDEEFEAVGVERLVRGIGADAALVMEPVDMTVVVAHKGFAWMEFRVRGRAAHGSDQELGIDAIDGIGRLIEELRGLGSELRAKVHDHLGSPTLHSSVIRGGEGWSTYPSLCELRVERRTLPGETIDDIRREMGILLERVREHSVEAEGEIVLFRGGTETSSDDEIVMSILEAGRMEGIDLERGGMAAWPEAGILNRHGIPSVVFGPSGCRGHESDEHVSIQSVRQCSRIIRRAAQRFLGEMTPEKG